MGDINYIFGMVRLLENPRQIYLKTGKQVVEVRVQFPQFRKTNLVKIICWGKLGDTVKKYYHLNSYLMVQGYLALDENIPSSHLTSKKKKSVITVLKIYPYDLQQ